MPVSLKSPKISKKQSPNSITPVQLHQLLQENDQYLHTLFIDISRQFSIQLGFIPGSSFKHPFVKARSIVNDLQRLQQNHQSDVSLEFSSLDSNTSSSGISVGDDGVLAADKNTDNEQYEIGPLEFLFTSNQLSLVNTHSLSIYNPNYMLDTHFKRIFTAPRIIVYDEYGIKGGWANQCVNVLLDLDSEIPQEIYYISGGIHALGKDFPGLVRYECETITLGKLPYHVEYAWVDDNHAKAFRPDEQDTEFLKPSTITSASESKTEEALPTVEMPMLSSNDMNTLKNLQNDDTHKDTSLQSQETSIVLTPIQALKQKQKHLIQSVWYGKLDPLGDIPICILPPFLFLGSCRTAAVEYVEKYKIKHIIRLGVGFANTSGDGVIYHDYHIEDSPSQPISYLFDKISADIEAARLANENVLVHCYAGVSRSSTIILAYLIKYQNLTLSAAFLMTYQARPIIRPNEGFSIALQEYEMDHRGTKESSMPLFWMSESFNYYMDYMEVLHGVGNF